MKQIFQRKSLFVCLLVVAILSFGLTACSTSGADKQAKSDENEGFTGTVTFGDAQWDSVEIHNAIARTILEKGYGIKTDVVSGSSASVLLGLERGDIDVLMEAWKLSYAGALEKALDSGKIQVVSENFTDDTQGLYVPRYVIEGDAERGIKPMAPDLKSVDQLPKYKDLFKDPNDPGKGQIMGAPSGYIADQTLQKKMKAYKLDETYNYFTPGSKTALVTSLDTAFREGKPWVGYGWTPTYFAAKYDLVLLKEPAYTEECWKSDMACAFPNDVVTIPVNTKFAKKAPKVVEFLSHYKTSAEITNDMLLYMGDHKASPEETAKWWLQTNDLWTKWVPEEIANKVKKALQ